jgi:hypothetical protein
VLSTLLEAVGFALIVSAAYFVAMPLALLVAGVGLIYVANVAAVRAAAKPKPEPTS